MVYEAPEGYWISDARVLVLGDNSGTMDSLTLDNLVDGTDMPRTATVPIACDPPNTPGAPGGWMEVEVYGTIEPIVRGSSSGAG